MFINETFIAYPNNFQNISIQLISESRAKSQIIGPPSPATIIKSSNISKNPMIFLHKMIGQLYHNLLKLHRSRQVSSRLSNKERDRPLIYN